MQSLKQVIFISITNGWAIRNYFQTGIISKLGKKYSIVIITTEDLKKGIIELGLSDDLNIIAIDLSKEPFIWKLLRQLQKKIYFESRQSSTEKIWRKYVKRPLYQKLGDIFFHSFAKYINHFSLLNQINKFHNKYFIADKLDSLITYYRPILILITHLSGYFDDYVIKNAIRLKLPITYMVMSWDHLSSKVVLNSSFNYIFVWNKITKEEILQTYPSYQKNQVEIVGIPQFDIYYEKPEVNFVDWCNQLKLNPSKRILYYSAAPFTRHEQQGVIIEDLVKDIKMGLLPSDLQILFKCHPLDLTRKYKYLEKTGLVRVIGYDNSQESNSNSWIPSSKELELQRNCLFFCTININVFSTVTLEAAFFNKPIIHIAFDPLPIKDRIPCHEYYNFEHFKPIVEIGASYMVKSRKEFNNAIQLYLQKPQIHFEERKALIDSYWETKSYPASETFVRQLIRVGNIVSRTSS